MPTKGRLCSGVHPNTPHLLYPPLQDNVLTAVHISVLIHVPPPPYPPLPKDNSSGIILARLTMSQQIIINDTIHNKPCSYFHNHGGHEVTAPLPHSTPPLAIAGQKIVLKVYEVMFLICHRAVLLTDNEQRPRPPPPLKPEQEVVAKLG